MIIGDKGEIGILCDLHTHTLLSDGSLTPSELIRRYAEVGIHSLGITDHVDSSNYRDVYEKTKKVCEDLQGITDVNLVPGVELTHVPPSLIEKIVSDLRSMKVGLVVVHGETIVEPVIPGTNRAAIEAGVDILAHPGIIKLEDAERAGILGVAVEISCRKGHSLCNGHVARLIERLGLDFVISSDAHSEADLLNPTLSMKVALGSGLSIDEYKRAQSCALKIVERAKRLSRGD